MKLALMCVFSFLLSAQVYSQEGIKADWKEVRGGKDVRVFAAEIPGKDVVAFRGEGTLDAPLKKVVAAFYDMDRKKEWMHELKHVKVVRYLSDKERVEYYHSGTPWPLNDRDFVYRAVFDLSADKNTFTLKIINHVEQDIPPVKGIVRGALHQSYYFLESIGNGTKTRIVAEILADPMGLVPKWVVNVFQRAWPIETISRLNKLATSSDFVVDPKVEEYFRVK